MKKIVNFKVEGETWANAQDKAFNKLNKTAKIDGFRPGKAPRNMFERKYGEEEILLEAADNLIKEKYKEIFAEGEIFPILEPKTDVVTISKELLEVNFNFIVKSEVKLGEYKNLKVKKEKVKVTKEEINHEIEHLLEHYAEMVEKEGKVENGDTVIIDFEGFKDEVAFEGGKAENYRLEIGSNSFIPGFEEGLVGLSKGDEKDLELTFPEDYHAEDLKGQKVVFKVKVNEIKNRIVPELNEEFFEDLDMEDINSKEDLEKMFTEQITAEKERIAENAYIDKLLETAAKNMKVEIDEELIQDEADRMYEDFLDKLAMQGLTEEIYFKYTNTTKEEMLETLKPEAEKRVTYRYLLEAIIEKEELTASDEEVDKEAVSLAEKYNMEKEDFLKELGGSEVLRYDMISRKAIDVMKSND